MILGPGFDAGRHHHPMEEEFFYILQGQLEMTIGTKSGVFGPGTLAYAPPHATHAQPSGHRNRARYSRQASSVAKRVSKSISVQG